MEINENKSEREIWRLDLSSLTAHSNDLNQNTSDVNDLDYFIRK